MLIGELAARVRFWRNADAIGPDFPWTHWRLHIKSMQRRLCDRMFASFGEGSEFRPGAYAIGCSRIQIGARVTIRPRSLLAADTRPDGQGIVIEDDVLLGPGVQLFAHNHRFEDPSVPISEQGYTDSKTITLRRGCWVGASAIILSGVEVGENAVIGAGSVVTRSVPPRTLVAGNPARVIREII